MNNPAVNHDAARQNIQFTANYHLQQCTHFNYICIIFHVDPRNYENLYMDKRHEPGINLVKFTLCFGGK